MWNAAMAVDHAENHARGSSQGRCAQYVREAIEAGGIMLMRQNDAKDYGRSLICAGFYEMLGSPLPGDIVVIQPAPGHSHGHMAIYNGTQWISDFKQMHGLYPGPAYRDYRPPYQIYRHH
jgi:hypothetical protein